MSRTTRRLAGVAVAGVCAAAALAAPTAMADNGKGKSQGPLLDIQILSFNDFHGNLEPISVTSSSGRVVGPEGNIPAGGVEYLATHLEQAREGHRNTITVAAGDLVGATPLLSAAFHDEPTVESMNLLGLDASAVGNHEFDEGYEELLRLQNGGCIDDGEGKDNQDSCPDGSFDGADFQYLAANVIETATGKTILPSYTIENRNGAKIAFIGMTLEGTPDIVTAAGVRGLEFTDEVETANALVPELKKKGVNAIVVLVHEGGIPPSPRYDYACDGESTISGPIVAIAEGLDPEIDMVVSGHTHQPYVCNIPDPDGKDRLVTSASSFGRLYTETNVQYDRRTQDIVRGTVEGANLVVTRDVTRNALQTELIAKYKELVAPVANRVIGEITETISRTQTAAGESPLGDLIADAQLADPSVVGPYAEPVIAFMNPGGIRGDLTYAASGTEGDGVVTFGEAFSVQPFNNYLVSMTLTGQQIYDLLNQQVMTAPPNGSLRVLQVSEGFTYSHNGSSVVEGSVMLDGTAIDKTASYRIVTNNFLADGGDGFSTFASGADRYFGGLDIDAFANYLEANSPYSPTDADRITRVAP